MTCGANKLATRISLVRALSFSLLLALSFVPALAAGDSQPASPPASPIAATPPATAPAAAAPVAATPASVAPAPEVTASIALRTRYLSLGIGKSVVIDLPRDAKD